jgi:hypothetical protein
MFAIVLGGCLATVANTTAPRSVDGNRISFLPPAHTLADSRDPAGVLVTQGEGSFYTNAVIQYVQVGAAHSSPSDPDENLAGPRRWCRNIHHLWTWLPYITDGSHSQLPSCPCANRIDAPRPGLREGNHTLGHFGRKRRDAR